MPVRLPPRAQPADQQAGAPVGGFDLGGYLAGLDERLLGVSQGRRAATKMDPLLFALVYLPHHLRSDQTGNQISFSRFHLELCDHAKRWAIKDLEPQQERHSWIAPRGSGKSTWFFLILPLWAMAHRHRKFVAAFANAGAQAEQHLMSLKQELDTNALLRADYPNLCAPATRVSTGAAMADNRSLYLAKNGTAFQAKGIDSSTLGAKVGAQRPDLLLFDDIEPEESNYSGEMKNKRLGTVLNAVFPMNLNAVVEMVGTTTMPGSIFHDLVQQVTDADPPAWPQDENIRVHYYPALDDGPDGEPRSLWPQRWALDYLQAVAHTRSFALNMQNLPMARDGDYWSDDDFQYGVPPNVTKVFCWVDPPVSKKKTSDPAGFAIVGYAPPCKTADGVTDPQVVVYHAEEIRETGAALADAVESRRLRWEARIGRLITGVMVEANQGGELWNEVFGPRLGVPMLTHYAVEAKEVRFARALDFYQRYQVWHAASLSLLEQQQVGFPRMAHDDVVDAACAGVLHFLLPPGPKGRSRTEYQR